MSSSNFTTDNWGYAPHNRQSFQQVQRLFPTARIKRGSGPVLPFARQLRDLREQTYTGVDEQTHNLQHMLEHTYTDAFVVLKDGIVITEEYANGMAAESHHLMNSVSKSFLGMLTGILASEGLLDPAEKVATYVPGFAATAFADTTVQSALDMTAAVRFSEDYAVATDDFWREASVVGWRPLLVTDESPSTLLDFALSLQQTEQREDEHFHYRTVLTNVVGLVLERVTGKSLQTLLEDKIWRPLGPEQDAAVVVDSVGFPYMGAGMNACARDLARFGEMLRLDGFYNGNQIVPADWVRDTREGNDTLRQLFAETDYTGLMPQGHYRNQVWADVSQGLMICIGIHGQSIHVNQATGVVIVKLSSHPEPVDLALFGDTFAALGGLSSIL